MRRRTRCAALMAGRCAAAACPARYADDLRRALRAAVRTRDSLEHGGSRDVADLHRMRRLPAPMNAACFASDARHRRLRSSMTTWAYL